MKKLLAVALLVSASSALAACGTGTPPAYERVEVRTAEPVFERRVTK